MTRETVMSLLKEYRFNIGRCGHLIAELKRLEWSIEAERTSAIETLAAPKPQQLSDMPHGTGIGNPTEKFGMMLAEGYSTPEIESLRYEVKKLTAEYDRRQENVNYVFSWLSGLPERERWVLESQVIDNVTWREIMARYRQRFGEDVSKDTLKRIRDKALDTVYRLAE